MGAEGRGTLLRRGSGRPRGRAAGRHLSDTCREAAVEVPQEGHARPRGSQVPGPRACRGRGWKNKNVPQVTLSPRSALGLPPRGSVRLSRPGLTPPASYLATGTQDRGRGSCRVEGG